MNQKNQINSGSDKLLNLFLQETKLMYNTLLTTFENNSLIITINRPDKLNALNRIVIEELSAVMDEVYNNGEIRSAIITGAGTKAFVAGADISEFFRIKLNRRCRVSKTWPTTCFR